jgi:hypothetical protein
MICERPGCGTVFCWDEADETACGTPRKRFCSTLCQKKASAQRAACAARSKRRFESRDKARDEAKRVWRQARLRKYPYECACGWWHLTSERPYSSAGSDMSASRFVPRRP